MVAFAVTFSDLLEKGGAYAGLAAFFGLAVLSVLYFAQARELKRLRDWAGRAPERAQELEQRVIEQAEQARQGRGVQAVPQQPRPQQPATAAAKAKPKPLAKPAAAAANAPATASVAPASETEDTDDDKEKTAITPATGDPTAGEHEVVASKGAEDAPVTDATAADAGAETAEDGEREPVGATARAAGATGDPVAPPQPQQPPGSTAPPGNGAPPAGEIPKLPARATPQPPPRRSAPAPAPYRPGGTTGGTRKVPPPRRPLYDEPEPPRRRNGILAAGAAAGLALIVVAIIAIAGGGGNGGGGTDTAADTPAATVTSTPDDGTGTTDRPDRPAEPARGDVRVRVLNGTTVAGLAAQVNEEVTQAGYGSGGEPENYADQARSASEIYFMNSEFRSQAIDLGELLTVPNVRLADAGIRALAPDADVVVVVGADQS